MAKNAMKNFLSNILHNQPQPFFLFCGVDLMLNVRVVKTGRGAAGGRVDYSAGAKGGSALIFWSDE